MQLPSTSTLSMLAQGESLSCNTTACWDRVYPVSESSMEGRFAIVVAADRSTWLSGQAAYKLKKGDEVMFRQTVDDLLRPYLGPPHGFDGASSITMVAGGGKCVVKYMQALHRIFDDTGEDKTSVTLLYGSSSTDEILLMEELTVMNKRNAGRLKVVFVVGQSRKTGQVKGWHVTASERTGMPSPSDVPIRDIGWLDQTHVHRYSFPPGGFFAARGLPTPDGWAKSELWLCGKPSMVEELIGADPTGEADGEPVLGTAAGVRGAQLEALRPLGEASALANLSFSSSEIYLW